MRTAARRVDGCSAQRLLDDVERPLQQLLQPVIDHRIIRPLSRSLLVVDARIESFKLTLARMVTAAKAPLTILVARPADFLRQVFIQHPSIGIALPGGENHGDGLFPSPRSDSHNGEQQQHRATNGFLHVCFSVFVFSCFVLFVIVLAVVTKPFANLAKSRDYKHIETNHKVKRTNLRVPIA